MTTLCDRARRTVDGPRIGALAALVLASLAGTVSDARAEMPQVSTVEYAIQAGDTCSGIARRFYDDGARWDIIHEFNPRLGPELPHRLVPGETLTLPPGLPPTAWVTEVVQRVEQRPGTAQKWQPAQSGTALSMGYRVNTHARSAAELTFRDASRVEMHQNTLLVVYGRTASDTKQTVNRVRLARGTLRSRMAALRGQAPGSTLRVESDASVAAMGSGEAVLSSGAGASAISNHGGGPISVAGLGGRGAVAVTAGMGTTVQKGRPPAAPRPLPEAPTWTPSTARAAWGAAASDGVIDLGWSPRPEATGYRVILERDGARFAAADLPASPATLTLSGLPAGRYGARITVTDGEGLVSLPSKPWTFTVAAVADGQAVPVGARVAGCHPPSAPAPDTVIAAGDNPVKCGGRELTLRGEAR